ncbi:ribosome-binding factor A [Sorangium sp. So ce1014]|uniref:ribosome-binding factor A n=1 Tax=Sorangium sp. So ce1014 TaxID=3133326 RepID=UPI003F643202
MGKDRSRSGEGARSVVDAGSLFGGTAARKAQRKERQLCRQVQEAVSDALAALHDDVLQDVWVVEVEPAPDASRLAVVVQVRPGTPPDVAAARLERVAGYVRAEVAGAITRKRAPTLAFQVLPPEGEL